MMAYRSSQHNATKFTPNMLMLGREVGLPLDVIVGSPEERTRTTGALDYVDGLRERLARAHEFARQHLRKAQSYQKQQYDRRAQGAGFEPGQAVWLFTPKKKVGHTRSCNDGGRGPSRCCSASTM